MIATKPNLSKEARQNLKYKPIFFGNKVLGSQYWSKQIEIMNAVRDNTFVSVGSGHNLSKTHTAADIALWFLGTRPGSLVITTAYHWIQIKHQIWKEIRHRYATSKFKNYYPNSECLTTELKMDGNIGNWIALGIATKDKDEKSFQGFKARKYVLIIIDEAPGISHEQWDGAMTMIGGMGLEGVEMKIFAIGNRLDPFCPFEKTFTDPKWKSFALSCFDSPNVTGEKTIPGLATIDWIEDRKDTWGEKSIIYKIRVLGLCPKEGLNTLIPLMWLEKISTSSSSITPKPPFYAGLDVADVGTNASVLTVLDREAKHVANYKWHGRTTQVERNTIEKHKEYKFDKLVVDALGVGVGVFNHLAEKKEFHDVVIPHKGSEASLNDMYSNKRTEVWYWVYHALENNEIPCIQNIGFLFQDLAGLRKEVDLKGKIKLESKEDYVKRLGRSPDEGDSYTLAYKAYKYRKATGIQEQDTKATEELPEAVEMAEFARDQKEFMP